MKKVDEDWKARVEKERSLDEPARPVAPAGPSQESKRDPKQRETKQKEIPQTDFAYFLSSLSMQAMIALGDLPHPATGQLHMDLEQARYLVDTLGILQEKTQGNLTSDESRVLEELLYELRMRYVAKMNEPQGQEPPR